MATKVEVILNGVGSITIEHDDEEWTQDEIKGYADEALQKLTALAPRRRDPIGFAAGDGTYTTINSGQDGDPYEFGRMWR